LSGRIGRQLERTLRPGSVGPTPSHERHGSGWWIGARTNDTSKVGDQETKPCRGWLACIWWVFGCQRRWLVMPYGQVIYSLCGSGICVRVRRDKLGSAGMSDFGRMMRLYLVIRLGTRVIVQSSQCLPQMPFFLWSFWERYEPRSVGETSLVRQWWLDMAAVSLSARVVENTIHPPPLRSPSRCSRAGEWPHEYETPGQGLSQTKMGACMKFASPPRSKRFRSESARNSLSRAGDDWGLLLFPLPHADVRSAAGMAVLCEFRTGDDG